MRFKEGTRVRRKDNGDTSNRVGWEGIIIPCFREGYITVKYDCGVIQDNVTRILQR